MNAGAADHPESLLEFWFGPARARPEAIGERMKFWFQPSAADDRSVAERFEPVTSEAAAGRLTEWQANPAGRLALILALDQAPRVIYRRQARAFEFDARALSLTLAGLDAGVDRELGLAERAFFYMPLQHSEDGLVQRISLRKYTELVEEHPEQAQIASGFLKHAREHAEIIERFGRYPHRNAVLGRDSSEEEKAFLENGPRYGQ